MCFWLLATRLRWTNCWSNTYIFHIRNCVKLTRLSKTPSVIVFVEICPCVSLRDIEEKVARSQQKCYSVTENRGAYKREFKTSQENVSFIFSKITLWMWTVWLISRRTRQRSGRAPGDWQSLCNPVWKLKRLFNIERWAAVKSTLPSKSYYYGLMPKWITAFRCICAVGILDVGAYEGNVFIFYSGTLGLLKQK